MFQLPTDNLYKFIALAGLVILGFSIYLPDKRLDELRRYQIQLIGEIEVLKLQTAEPCPPLELKIKWQEINTKAKIESLLYEQIQYLVREMWCGIASGAFLTILGFYCWYFKIQKPQDSILARDASAKFGSDENPPTEPADVQSGK